MPKGITAINFLFREMNCNIFILCDCEFSIKGEPRPYRAQMGEVFSGTYNDGSVLFHVTSKANGKIYPIWIAAWDGRVNVEMFKNQTSV